MKSSPGGAGADAGWGSVGPACLQLVGVYRVRYPPRLVAGWVLLHLQNGRAAVCT